MGPDTLFRITDHSTEDDVHVFDVRLDPGHPVFAGHFPDMAVLPGVCSMYILRSCAGAVAGKKMRYDTVKECKFLSAILPGTHSRLTVRICVQPAEESYVLAGTIEAGVDVMVRIKATLTADESGK